MHISKIFIDVNSIVRGDNYKSARDQVITDLLEKNHLVVLAENAPNPPFNLHISIAHNKFVLQIEGDNNAVFKFDMPITPFKRIIKDYSIICSSYFEALKTAEVRKIEAIDMGRRAAHNDGAEILIQQLENKIEIDFDTARKLFSLIYLLQEK